MNVTCYHFKHYTDKTLALSPTLQVIVGNNGSGKSTLCEALSILANASNPHHTSWEEKSSFELLEKEEVKVKERNFINNSENFTLPPEKGDGNFDGKKGVGERRVNDENTRGGLGNEWALRWQIGETFFQSLFDGKNKSPKWYLGENSVSKPKYEDVMPYRALWIQSDHLRVISGEPSERRNFLDDMLIFASPTYSKIQKNYKTALASRNRVIQSILDREAVKSDLSSWDTLLAEYAAQVIAERRKFFAWFEKAPLTRGVARSARGFEDDSKPEIVASTLLAQGSTILQLPGPVKIELTERHPLAEVSKESFLELLKQYTERDLVVGRTTIGPHLDEIAFSVNITPPEKGGVGGLANWQPTKYILSRGENKILLLAFIRLLGEYVREVSGKEPLFLLDDVLSELDEGHTEILCQLFANTTTIMTTQPNHTAGLPADIVKIELA